MRVFLNTAALSRVGILIVLVSLLVAAGSATAQPSRLAAPNVVDISAQLVTSGQPSREALSRLESLGFEAVIYLAPADVQDAVRDEQSILTRQGLTFVNIPVQFDKPTERDFETFAAVLTALRDRKVLVHCQINLRASSMVFLYRTLVLHEPADSAYRAVTSVWKPEGPWRRLIEDQLHKHHVQFDIY